MKYEYGGWIIDATAEFSLGQFFARARLIRLSPDDEADAEMHIERNLAWLENEDEAIQVARRWAIQWIDARNNNIASANIVSSAQWSEMPAKTAAR
jgi:hypothetical protein